MKDIPTHTGGALLSPPDPRDYKARDYLARGSRPKSLWPDQRLPAENQGKIGCCVAQALAAMKSYMEYRERKSLIQYSVDYIYHNRRPNDFQGNGMFCREALAQLRACGVPERRHLPSVTPYPSAAIRQAVTALADLARDQVISSYLACDDDGDICDAIAQSGAAVIVVEMVPSFSANYKVFGGGLTLGQAYPDETGNGYHAICACGYDDRGVLIQNSWGDGWGDGGFAIVPYHYGATRERWTAMDKRDQWDIIELYVDDKRARRNGVEMLLDVPPRIIDGRAMVPLRFIGEALGAEVEWIGGQRKIVARKRR